jgi:hypothetical protein
LGSKKDVLPILSVNNIVMALANIGNDNTNNIAVINIAQLYNDIVVNLLPGLRIPYIVAIKLIAPNIELIPAICNENIPKSTLPPE